tara:strand:+ start:11234 stop:12646 length:1413 start_codon:yes stop_codon:yes gene_type:complete
MNAMASLFRQTAVYGFATVFPRALSFLLLPLYTSVFIDSSGYGEYVLIYSWIAIFNILFSYGMETAFFRFFHNKTNAENTVFTALFSLLGSSIVLGILGYMLIPQLAILTGIRIEFLRYVLAILILDALVVIPFALLRANEKARRYATIKSLSVAVNFGFNLFFLLVLGVDQNGQAITYIFLANIIASTFTLLIFTKTFFGQKGKFEFAIWQSMLKYALPVMFAGIAFTINEVLDKILINQMLSSNEAGIYAACYKLTVFMTLFATAFRMGVEPFFFKQAKEENRNQTYALITRFFVAFGVILFLTVVVFVEPLARLFITKEQYLEGLSIVPIVLYAALFLGIYHSLSVWYKIIDKPIIGTYISWGGALITLFINILFIPQWGYYAGAIATLSAYFFMAALSFLLSKKLNPIPYDLKSILIYLVLALILAYIVYIPFDKVLWKSGIVLLAFSSFVLRRELKHYKNQADES